MFFVIDTNTTDMYCENTLAEAKGRAYDVYDSTESPGSYYIIDDMTGKVYRGVAPATAFDFVEIACG